MSTRFVSALLGGSLILATACPGDPCDLPENANSPACAGDSDTDTDTDSDTDSDTDADGEATIVATVTFPDGTEATDAPVSVELGPAEVVAEGWSGDELVVPAPATYRVLAGDRGNTTHEDLPLPLVTDGNGWEWVSPVYETDVTDEGLIVTTRPLHKYYWGAVVCDGCIGDGCIGDEDYQTYEEGTYGVEEGIFLDLPLSLGQGSWFEFLDNGNIEIYGDLADAGDVVVPDATVIEEHMFFVRTEGEVTAEYRVTFYE